MPNSPQSVVVCASNSSFESISKNILGSSCPSWQLSSGVSIFSGIGHIINLTVTNELRRWLFEHA
jgi:hypothetical protein